MLRSPCRTNVHCALRVIANYPLFSLFVLASWFAWLGEMSIAQALDPYLNQIKPLLTEKCISCHGALRSEAGLRLDAIQFIRAGSDSGSIVVNDTLKGCKLVERVTSQDIDYRMPPEDAGTALTKEQTQWLTNWIEAKLPGPEQESFLASPRVHWAYQPIVRPALPHATRDASENPIDRIVRGVQEEKQVRSLGTASDSAWLRRVTFDLTGLPPTVDELKLFIEDSSLAKRQQAIDHLLSKPSYGERWGRHWMDIWRYSDWDGYKNELRTSQRHIWHWRDWIIESLNANKPYAQMIVEMLAADELVPGNQETLRATGFLARNFHKSNRNIWLDATVEHTAKAFLGLTLNCAKCHDHKYDPIPQTAYYQFRAVFEPHRIRTDQIAGVANIDKDGIPRAYDEDLDAATYLYVRGNDKNPLKDSPVKPSVPDFFSIPFEIVPIALPLESYYPELSDLVRQNVLADKEAVEKSAFVQLHAKISALEKERAVQSDSRSAGFDSRGIAEIELATSKLNFAIADRTSTLARYAAEKTRCAIQSKFDSKYVCRRDNQIGSAIHPEGRLPFRHGVNAKTSWSVRPLFNIENPSNPWLEWTHLAKKASQAEFWHMRAQASHDVLLQQRAYDAAVKLHSKETDSAKREAAIKPSKDALAKSRKTLDQFASEPSVESTTYTPIGKELPHQSSGRRLALAKWIVHSDNPLTARVAINHIWMRHFGTPLVENTFDFGMSSPRPELLDALNWLSAELITNGWDMKHIHRLILNSDVYATASDSNDVDFYQANNAKDPENTTYWRANVRRLDAEEIRDSMLAVSDALEKTFCGPDLDFADGEKNMRRSLYFQHAYEKQMPMLVLFDAASPNECYRRKPSLVPQQALALANSGLARNLANRLAEASLKALNCEGTETETDAELFIERLFLTALARPPSNEEQKACMAFLKSQTNLMRDPDHLTRFSDDNNITESNQSPSERARQSLAIVLFNHHDFVTIR